MFKWGIVMVQKNVTISLNEETYEKYKKFCSKKAIALSKSIENFMIERMDDEN